MKKVKFFITYEEYVKLNNKMFFLPAKANFFALFLFILVSFLVFYLISSTLPFFSFRYGRMTEINVANILLTFILELGFIIFFAVLIFLKRYSSIKRLYKKYIENHEYQITADETFLEINVGNKIITKYSWDNVSSIREFYGYYLVNTNLNSNRFCFFPKNTEDAESLAEFIKKSVIIK
jgi:hypothetical protein